MRDSIDFGKADIGKLFSSLFFPTLLGMLFSMAFIFTDGIFVGHGIGPDGLAAINLIGPIMMLINGLGIMFGTGVSVVAAIHLSHGNLKAARINVTQVFLAGMTVSLLMGLFCYLFPDIVLGLLGAKGTLYGPAREYYMWFIPTCLLMMIENIGLFVIRLDGSPRYAMLANMIPAVVNIVLDYLFIFPCGWGLMGASLVTDIGGLVAVIMVVYYMVFQAKQLRLYRLKWTRKSLRLMARNVGYMMRMGASGLVGELAVSVMMLTGNLMFMRHLGTEGVSAYSVACYLFPLIYMMYIAVSSSAQPIISFNHGAQADGRVHKTMALSICLSLVMGVVITAFFVFLAPTIVHIFLEGDTGAGRLAAEGLPYYAAGIIFMGLNITMVGYYQSIERPGLAVLLTALRGIIFLVAAFLLLPRLIGPLGLWLAIPVAEALTTLVVIALQLLHGKN